MAAPCSLTSVPEPASSETTFLKTCFYKWMVTTFSSPQCDQDTYVRGPLLTRIFSDILQLLMFPCRRIRWVGPVTMANLSTLPRADPWLQLGNLLSILTIFFFFCMTLYGCILGNNFWVPRPLAISSEQCYDSLTWNEYNVKLNVKTTLASVTVHVDRLSLNSLVQWWDQWVGKGSQKFQGCNWVVACP